MGLLNGDRQRAVRALSEMYQRRLMVIPRDTEWQIAQDMLTRSYTREHAESSSIAASVRIKYLEVAEPAPVREMFVPPTPPPPHRSVQALEEVERRFEQAWHEHASRDSWRAQEIEYIKSVHARVAAAKRVQCIERNRARWPAGTDIDDGLLAIDDMAIQVEAQNENLDERREAVGNLLSHGLADDPCETAGPTGHRDPQSIRDSVENALVLMHLPDGFEGAVKVGYSSESRQVVVEYELPTDAVIPKVKSYRWVKSKNQCFPS